tara:strand:+ start:774 stop:1010 length:237 start_codon:yes stop_codon:yes gene_type:complete
MIPEIGGTMPHLSIRTDGSNPNHHLWNNNGTWFTHYTLHTSAFTAERVRRSLGTKSLTAARSLRDHLFRQLAGNRKEN